VGARLILTIFCLLFFLNIMFSAAFFFEGRRDDCDLNLDQRIPDGSH